MRNHEVNIGDGDTESAFQNDAALADRLSTEAVYDVEDNDRPCPGGTTTLIYDTAAQQVERQFLSLAWTVRNCAGGPTPWNTWVTCEETVVRAGEGGRADHGYPFEVPATAEPQLADPVPLKGMGRFNHEAVAADPNSGVVYQTEDRHDGLLYRYLPDKPGTLEKGGRLQALMVAGHPSTASTIILRVEYAISKFPNHGPSFRAHPGKYSVVAIWMALLPA